MAKKPEKKPRPEKSRLSDATDLLANKILGGLEVGYGDDTDQRKSDFENAGEFILMAKEEVTGDRLDRLGEFIQQIFISKGIQAQYYPDHDDLFEGGLLFKVDDSQVQFSGVQEIIDQIHNAALKQYQDQPGLSQG